MNLKTKSYDKELLSLFNLEEIYETLPPLKGSTDICGTITAESSELTGLLKNTPVAGGMSPNLLLNIISDFPVILRSVDIVEVSPPLDTPAGITAKLQMAIITELLGKFWSWKELGNEKSYS